MAPQHEINLTNSSFADDAATLSATTAVFICYRRDDGDEYAKRIHHLLHDIEHRSHDGTVKRITVFFDQTAPGVADWEQECFPALYAAKAFIVISTRGLRPDLSEPSEPDYAHEEISYWCENRGANPILLDGHPESNGRWIPTKIKDKWPRLNRIYLPEDPDQITEENTALRQRIIDTIRQSEKRSIREDIEEKTKLNHKLASTARTLRIVATFAAILATAATVFAFESTKQQRAAEAITSSLDELLQTADPDLVFTQGGVSEQLLIMAEDLVNRPNVDDMRRSLLLRSMASAYIGRNNYGKAIELLNRVSAYADSATVSPTFLFELNLAFGEAHLYAGEIEKSQPYLEVANELARSGLSLVPRQMSNLSVALGDLQAWSDSGSAKKAADFYSAAVEIDSGENFDLLARDKNRLGALAHDNQQYISAKRYYNEAVQHAQQSAKSLPLADSFNGIASIDYQLGNLEEALENYYRARKAFTLVNGTVDHTDVAAIENNIGRVLIELDRIDEAMPLLLHSKKIREEQINPKFRGLAFTNLSLGVATMIENPPSARPFFERSIEISEKHRMSIGAQAYVHLAEIALDSDDLLSARSYIDLATEVFSNHGINSGWRHALLLGVTAELTIADIENIRAPCDTSIQAIFENVGNLLDGVASDFRRRKWTNKNVFLQRLLAREQKLADLEGSCT